MRSGLHPSAFAASSTVAEEVLNSCILVSIPNCLKYSRTFSIAIFINPAFCILYLIVPESTFPAKELNRNHAKSWNLLKENEFLLQKEVAFELGIRSQPSTCYQAVTSSKELISEDQILLYGPDLPEIKKSVPFTRITWIQIDPIEDQDKAYQRIKKLEFAKFKIIPEGYMMLSSSMDQKEQVRVSKKAVKKGLDFATVGNLMIQRYKEEFQAKHVQILFITRELPVMDQLIAQGKKVDEITNAFDHILKNIILDCDLCPLHPICDDVEELRQIHFARK